MSPSNLTAEVWPATDAGQAESNEDYVLLYQPTDAQVARYAGSLYVVVDGEGGGTRGTLASRYAAQKVMHAYYTSDEPDLGLRLRQAVQAANADLFQYARQRPELVKLSASLVAAAIRGEQVHVAAVGSCRAYLIRKGSIHRITHDHTLVQQLLDEGAITAEEAREHPRRDLILRTLGTQEEIAVDIFDLRLQPDDALLLCSDGLTRYLEDEEIAQIASSAAPRSAAETLIRRANERGGKDNITVVSALMRAGAPPLAGEVPHMWDGSMPSFEEQPTLAVPRVERPSPPPDETMPTMPTRAVPAPSRPTETAPAPPYAQPVQPAPPYAAPPPGYAIDPVTGLPPVPPPRPEGPPQPGQPAGWTPQPSGGYQPRIYQPPTPRYAQRRGVPLGLFVVVGLLAIVLTALMVVLLINPLDWELPIRVGAGGPPAAATQVGGGAVGIITQTAMPTSTPTVTPLPPTPTPTVEPTPQAPPGMVLIEGGAFLRGVSDDEVARAINLCINETEPQHVECYPEYFTDAQPVEEVTLSPFFIDITEVTNAAYAECVAAEVCTPPQNTEFYDDPAFAQHPVVYVTWDQARTFCEWAGKRLPTEAEWEKAARWDPATGESYWWPWGNEFVQGQANTLSAGLGGLSAVQAFPRDVSPTGVLGMAGNASEWVADWYFESYEGLGTLNPTGPANYPYGGTPYRVVRGGSYLELDSRSRAGHRFTVNPASAQPWLGFRCAQSVGGEAAPQPTPTVETPAATPPEETATPAATATPQP